MAELDPGDALERIRWLASDEKATDAFLGRAVRRILEPEMSRRRDKVPPNVIDLIGWLGSHKPRVSGGLT